ncbi:hypothetical protein [Runella sp.]|uniref:hypothetical protein n=1 Tax=Runella sp. TaxID=1960881 RepID=UPI00301B162A
MLQLEDFVLGATIRLSFDVSALPAGTSLSGKLQRDGETFNFTSSTNGNVMTLSDTTHTRPAGKYKFVFLWYTVATGEPIEELEADLIIKPRK